ncbi:MAG: YHS domain-containing protein, partial [Acidobacteriota bacterium]
MKDPICGMDVDPGKAAGSAERDGKTYWFCSKGCQKKFEAGAESAAPVAKPELVLDPVCGMKVDPAHAAATSEYGG